MVDQINADALVERQDSEIIDVPGITIVINLSHWEFVCLQALVARLQPCFATAKDFAEYVLRSITLKGMNAESCTKFGSELVDLLHATNAKQSQGGSK